jgi:long-chain acyl-CoA synthetase
VAEQWEKVVGSKIAEGYGLSETSPMVTVNPSQGEIRLGTIGIPAPDTDVRIVDDNGKVLPPGEAGELLVKGPQVMQGYWNRPDETEKVMKDGWFSTGDMAVIDERGYISIVDRKKDMIDVSGFNVYPNEVEEALSGHPKIAEVAVIGVPQPQGGETVRAYVVRTDQSVGEDDIISYAREYLTAYKVPKEIIFREDLPKTPVGKILRKDLRKEAEAEA